MGTSLTATPGVQDDLDALGINFDLLEQIHCCYQAAGFDGPSEVVDWMEKKLKKGKDPIPGLRAMVAGVCDVVLAGGGSGEHTTSRPTILAWLDRGEQSFVLEVRG